MENIHRFYLTERNTNNPNENGIAFHFNNPINRVYKIELDTSDIENLIIPQDLLGICFCFNYRNINYDLRFARFEYGENDENIFQTGIPLVKHFYPEINTLNELEIAFIYRNCIPPNVEFRFPINIYCSNVET